VWQLAMVLAVVFLGEKLSAMAICGGALIVIGSIVMLFG